MAVVPLGMVSMFHTEEREKIKGKSKMPKLYDRPLKKKKSLYNDSCLHFVGWNWVIRVNPAVGESGLRYLNSLFSVMEIKKKYGCGWVLHIWCVASQHLAFQLLWTLETLIYGNNFICNLTYIIMNKKKVLVLWWGWKQLWISPCYVVTSTYLDVSWK